MLYLDIFDININIKLKIRLCFFEIVRMNALMK